jgi:hypothetical protein
MCEDIAQLVPRIPDASRFPRVRQMPRQTCRRRMLIECLCFQSRIQIVRNRITDCESEYHIIVANVKKETANIPTGDGIERSWIRTDRFDIFVGSAGWVIFVRGLGLLGCQPDLTRS